MNSLIECQFISVEWSIYSFLSLAFCTFSCCWYCFHYFFCVSHFYNADECRRILLIEWASITQRRIWLNCKPVACHSPSITHIYIKKFPLIHYLHKTTIHAFCTIIIIIIIFVIIITTHPSTCVNRLQMLGKYRLTEPKYYPIFTITSSFPLPCGEKRDNF